MAIDTEGVLTIGADSCQHKLGRGSECATKVEKEEEGYTSDCETKSTFRISDRFGVINRGARARVSPLSLCCQGHRVALVVSILVHVHDGCIRRSKHQTSQVYWRRHARVRAGAHASPDKHNPP